LSEHTSTIDPSHAGGAALVVGFLVVIGALYARDPTVAVDAATANPTAAAYFLVLPTVGLAVGVYAYAGGPYSGIPLFCLGSYLGVFGVGLAFGTLVAESPSVPLLIGGVALVALAVVAIVASLLQLFGSVDVGLPGISPK
jgi:hypothetical protein